ncbi:MAG: ABC transporter ATP-binding protein/permease, partial [Firmicutes bacterium]|nr:ABC transporter ATP-binding protein/permease [Bacillota bacterium]
LNAFLNPLIAIVLASITVFIIDWRMGIGSLIVGAIVFVLQSRFAAPLAKLGKERLEANADSVKAMSNIFAGALTIRAFGRQRQALVSFDRETGKLRKIDFKQAFIGMWQDIFTTVQGWLSLVLVFAFGGWLVANGQMELPQLMIILPLASTVGGAMSNIGAAYAGLQPPIVAAKRIFDVIDAVPDLDKPKVRNSVKWDGNYTINLSKLYFAYKDADKDALKNIDLTIGENQMVAFVGESGSGKSTFLRLLIGMYERNGLNMEIGNLPFTSGNLDEWRNHFSYVDQSCKLFDMSIAENIAMGKQGNATEEEITAAAKRAFADEFITALPDGYATQCGEKGASLSGGQKQRIAIARALCHKAQVLVFDEATSALDPESEKYVMQTIESLRKDHTILITTHNLHNIRNADKIVVMDNGNIAEVGTHDELVSKGGVYKRLLDEQNSA